MALCACGQGGDAEPDTGVADAALEDARVTDAVPRDAGDPVANDFGFEMRTPRLHTLDCDPPDWFPTLEQLDVDWLCTFDYDGTSGHVYLQNAPIECLVEMSPVATFESEGAFIAIDGSVSSLENGHYDWGGNHHIDTLEFSYGGKLFRYAHSSLNFAYRPCHDMDCAQVYSSATGPLVEDGCTDDRTLPVVCVQIEAGGDYGEDDLVDTFEPCEQ